MKESIQDTLVGAAGFMFGSMASDDELDSHASVESMFIGAFNFWRERDEGAKALFAMSKKDFLIALEKEARKLEIDATPWQKWDADPETRIRDDSDIDLSKG